MFNFEAFKKVYKATSTKVFNVKTIDLLPDEVENLVNNVVTKKKADKDKVYIQCRHCGHCEEVNKQLFAKIIGGAVVGLGGYAWVSFLFAGTGFALPLCIAIVAGGTALTAFSKELTEWFSKKYKCENCGMHEWNTITGKELILKEKLNAMDNSNIERYNSVTAIPILHQLYEEAEEYIYISYGWIAQQCVEEDFPYLKRALSRGVKLVIYFGIMPRENYKFGGYIKEDINRLRKTLEAIDYLKEKLSNPKQMQCICTDTHTKMTVCEKYTLHGSHNLLSYRPDTISRSEYTDKVYSKRAIELDRQTICA